MVDDPNKTESGSFSDDDDFLSADAGPIETTQEKRSLKEIWDQTPSLKIFAIIAVIAISIIIYLIFSGGSSKSTAEEASNISKPSSITQAPGTAELPPAYEEAVRQANKQVADQAVATGGSALPTPIARPAERIEAPVQVEDSDPLSEWRKEAESRRMERQQEDDNSAIQTAPPPPPTAAPTSPLNSSQQMQVTQAQQLPTGPTQEQVSQLAGQFQQFITQNVMEPQTPKDSVVISLGIQPGYDATKYFPPANTANGGGANNSNGGQTGGSAGAPQPQTPPAKPLITAGTIAYAQILTEANSDIPGPVLAEVASGPLVGGRAIGQFQVARDHMVVTFNRVIKDGVEYHVQCFALDPATTLPGVVSSIDYHYFRRVFLPAAARFIQGFADAATQTDTSTIITNGTVVTNNTNDLSTKQELLEGVDQGAQEVGNIIEQDANRPITVKLKGGTRIGLLFMSPVYDPSGAQQQEQMQNPYGQPQPSLGQTVFNATPVGQAYNAYNAYNSASGGAGIGGTGGSAPPGSYAATQAQRYQNTGYGGYNQAGYSQGAYNQNSYSGYAGQ